MFIGSFTGGKGAVVLTNGQSDGLVYSLIARIAEVYDWEGYLLDQLEIPQEVDLPKDSLTQYTGAFRCLEDPENTVEVTLWENKRLLTTFKGGEYAHPIYFPMKAHSFWAESYSLYSFTKLTFVPAENGSFNRFILSNPDKTTTWERIIPAEN